MWLALIFLIQTSNEKLSALSAMEKHLKLHDNCQTDETLLSYSWYARGHLQLARNVRNPLNFRPSRNRRLTAPIDAEMSGIACDNMFGNPRRLRTLNLRTDLHCDIRCFAFDGSEMASTWS